MEFSDIKDQVRQALQDTVGTDSDRSWPDKDLNVYINEACRVFCRMTRIIRDSITDSVCLITLTTGDRHKQYSQLIIPGEIERIKSSYDGMLLTATTVEQLDQQKPDWENETGEPDSYALDYSSGYVSLNRAVESNGTLRLTVRRLPLKDLTANDDTPEFNPTYHYMLKDYALYLAFSKQDAETYNPDKAAKHLALFWGTDELHPGGHIGRVLKELDNQPQTPRRVGWF